MSSEVLAILAVGVTLHGVLRGPSCRCCCQSTAGWSRWASARGANRRRDEPVAGGAERHADPGAGGNGLIERVGHDERRPRAGDHRVVTTAL